MTEMVKVASFKTLDSLFYVVTLKNDYWLQVQTKQSTEVQIGWLLVTMQIKVNFKMMYIDKN